MIRRIFIYIFLLIISLHLNAQKEDLSQVWPAKWIAAIDGPWKEYAVHRFRNTFFLEEIPEKLIIHTSGDNRYRLYVNGEFQTWGPQLGDLDHWYYESTDIAPFLRKGKNVIAAEVLNYGSHPPDAKLSVQTAFLLCSDEREYRFLNTSDNWKAKHDPSYSPNIVSRDQVHGYYGGGSREIVNDNLFLWNWNSADYNDSAWQAPSVIETAFAKTCKWASRWKLTPRTLPHEELSVQVFESIRDFSGVKEVERFLEGVDFLVIPPETTARLIFDQAFETTAYPVLSYSGGKDAIITIRYSEAPVMGDIRSRKKGNRNEIDGKNFYGYFDRILVGDSLDRLPRSQIRSKPQNTDRDYTLSANNHGRVPFKSFSTDHSNHRIKTYIPFWWRAFRYIELTIETKDQPLQIHSFYNIASTYPFKTRSGFQTGNPEAEKIDRILEIGERTVRNCAHESFMDCPYYEESQFEGDTRVQALVSYSNFGDPSLGKNAIEQFSWSLNSEGFLSARYPTNSTYYIPNYSIYWIGMLYDYMMHFDDPGFIKSKLPATRLIMSYFQSRMREDGSIRKPDYHNFVDWAFPSGEPPFDEQGYSALVDLHFLMALQWAEALEREFGDARFADDYSRIVKELSVTIREKYYKKEKGLFSDTPAGNDFSIHTNVFAILTGVSKGMEAKSLMQGLLPDTSLIQPTIYFSFYLFEALKKAGLADLYLENLQVWEEMMAAGVTTWPETGLESRSECHAWGASPNYHFYKIVAGIEPGSAGFKKVIIEPGFESLGNIKVSYPHPAGNIEMELENSRGNIQGSVFLPGELEGVFKQGEKIITLKPGLNKIDTPAKRILQ